MAHWFAALLVKTALLQAAAGALVDIPSGEDGHCPSQGPPVEAAQERALLQKSVRSSKEDVVDEAAPRMGARRHPPSTGLQVHAVSFVNSHSSVRGSHTVVAEKGEAATQRALQTPGSGNTESLDEAGYQVVAATCCTYQMEEFIRRVVTDLGLQLCGEDGLTALAPSYSCELGIQDYNTLHAEVLDKATSACPVAALPDACPTGTASCTAPDPAYHRRRNCRTTTSFVRMTTTTEGSTTTTETTTTVTTTTTTTTTTETTTAPETTTTEPPIPITTTKVWTGCKGETEILDIFNSKMVHSNLGGRGPDDGYTAIRYEGAGMFQGRLFDILVQATSAYTPITPADNGFECGHNEGCTTGHFGEINIAAGTSVDLTLSFQDSATQTPVTLSKFLFSLHDIDMFDIGAQSSIEDKKARSNSTIEEIIYIGGFVESILDNATEVGVTLQADGRTKLVPYEHGSACDDPDNPSRLGTKICDGKTIDQRKRSAAFVFADTSVVSLTLEVTCNGCAADSGRSFLFAGDTNLVRCAGDTVQP